MPFLTLNGWTVPVAQGGVVQSDDVGAMRRAFGGRYGSTRIARKNKWRFDTVPLNELEASILQGMLRRDGHLWSYDTDLFSDLKGLGPGSTVGSIRFGTSGDGLPVHDEDTGISESKHGAGSLATDGITTNLLSANQADVESGTTGFTALGTGSLAVSTAHFLEGLQSLQVTTTDTTGGFETTTVAASASTVYTAHLYIKGSTTSRDVTLFLRDDDIGTITSKVVEARDDRWHRIKITGTTGGSATAINVRILDDQVAGGTVFYVDALQIETGSVPSTWVHPDLDPRGAASPGYNGSFLKGAAGVTLNVWARGITASPGTTTYICSVVAGTDVWQVARPLSTTNLAFSIGTAAGSATVTETGVWDDDWHMVTAVFRYDPEAGEDGMALYVDGVLVQSDTPIIVLRPTFLMEPIVIVIGAFIFGSTRWTQSGESLLDAVRLLPYPVNQDVVTAWFATEPVAPPRIDAAGDFDPRASVVVEGRLLRAAFAGRQDTDNAAWKSNKQAISFELIEV